MKLFAVISLIMLMLVQPLSKMLIVAEYQVNKNYIATVLCINKNKPELRCEGKCHLTKELGKASQSENKVPELLHIKAELPFIIQPFLVNFFPDAEARATAFTPYHFAAVTALLYSIFHPPRF